MESSGASMAAILEHRLLHTQRVMLNLLDKKPVNLPLLLQRLSYLETAFSGLPPEPEYLQLTLDWARAISRFRGAIERARTHPDEPLDAYFEEDWDLLIQRRQVSFTNETDSSGCLKDSPPVTQPKPCFNILEGAKLLDQKASSSFGRHQLESQFNQIRFNDPYDSEAFKKLISLLAHTVKRLSVNGNDEELKGHVMHWTMEALPPKLQAWVKETFGQTKMDLPALLRSLAIKLVCFNSFKQKQWKEQMKDQMVAARASGTWYTFPRGGCHYCKQTGHVTDECPDIAKLLCFRCFNFGHKKTRCTNEPLFEEAIL